MVCEGDDRLRDRDATRTSLSATMTGTRTTARAAALSAMLGLAAVSWVVAVRQMNGMDMGVATELDSFAFFVALWVPMMAAMMLPGAVPAVSSLIRIDGRALAAPLFAGSYLAVWTMVGLAVYVLYQPHGTLRRRRIDGRGRRLRAHAAQTRLPPALARERPLGIRVRDLPRRLEHRADGDAAGTWHHERHLDGGRRRIHPRPQAFAAASIHRRAARVDDHRPRNLDRRRTVGGPRNRAGDVNVSSAWLTLDVTTRKGKESDDAAQDRNT